jgi:hypothetical protein
MKKTVRRAPEEGKAKAGDVYPTRPPQQRSADALLARLFPLMRAVVVEHLAAEAAAPRRTPRPPVVLPGDDEVASEVDRALARRILDRNRIPRGRR